MTIREIAIAFGYEIDKKSEQLVEHGINRLKSVATKALGAIGIGFSLTQMNEIAEEFSRINTQIRNATRGMGEQGEIQQKILQAANDSRTSYESMARSVTSLVNSAGNLFGSIDEASEFASVSTKLFRTAGKSQAEAVAMQESLNSAFVRGKIDAGTLQQLFKEVPQTVDMFSKSLGLTKGAMLALAGQGLLGTRKLKDAIMSSASVVNAEFEKMGYNVSDAFQYVRNKWGLFINGLNSGIGVSQTIGTAMVNVFDKILDGLKRLQGYVERIAKSMGGMKNLLRALAIAAGVMVTALRGREVLGFLTKAFDLIKKINLKMMATVAIVAIIALLIEDFIAFMKGEDSLIGSMFEQMGVDANKMREEFMDIWNELKDFFSSIWGMIGDLAKSFGASLLNLIKSLIPFLIQLARKLLPFLLSALQKILPLIIKLADALLPIIFKLLDAILPLLGPILDLAMGLIEPLLDLIEALLPIIDLLMMLLIDILEPLIPIIKLIADVLVTVLGAAFKVIGEIIGGVIDGLVWFVDLIKSGLDWVGKIGGKIGDAVRDLFGGGEIDATVTHKTAGTAATSGSVMNRNMNQSVIITNNFNGSDRAAQQQGAKAMNQSADDAVAAMARGMAYGG